MSHHKLPGTPGTQVKHQVGLDTRHPGPQPDTPDLPARHTATSLRHRQHRRPLWNGALFAYRDHEL